MRGSKPEMSFSPTKAARLTASFAEEYGGA